MYWRCPRQYYFRYVLGGKSPPAVAMTEGRVHHMTFEKNNIHKIKKGNDYGPKTVIQFFCDTFDVEQKDIPKEEWKKAGEKKDDVIDRGKKLLEKYMKEEAPKLTPELAELEVEYVVGDVSVLGIIDVGGIIKIAPKITRRGVFDYKVTKSKVYQDDIDNEIALAHYGWAALTKMDGFDMKIKPPQVGYINLTKTKTPQIHKITIPLEAKRLKWYRKQVISIANSISLGSFPIRNSVGWECSEKFCGYWKKCKGNCK
jgi:hypothetical protein